MGKYNIPIIALVIFSITILLANNNIEKAFALTLSDTVVGADGIRMKYNAGRDAYEIFRNTLDAEGMQFVDANTKAITTMNFPQPTAAGSYVASDCDSTSCFVVYGTSSGADRILRLSIPSGSVLANQTNNFSGMEGSLLSIIKINSGSVFVGAVCSDSDRILLVLSATLTETGRIGDCAGTNIGNNIGIFDMQISGTRIALTTSALNNGFQLWNTGGSNVCKGLPAYSNENTNGAIARNSASSTWLVTTDSSQRVDIINDSCSDTGDITSAQHGLTTTLRGIDTSDTRDEIYIVSTTTVAVMDLDSPSSLLFSFSTGGDATVKLKTDPSEEFAQFAVLSGTNLRIAQLDPIDEPTSSIVCIDTTLDGIADLCFTDTNNDGVADNGFAGGLGAFTSNANITDIGTQWFCAFNIGAACNDADVRTNGVGLFYLAIILIFSYAILIAIHIKAVEASSKDNVQLTDALRINPILLLVMLLIDVGLAWSLQFISDVIFFTTIVVLAGLAGFGFYRHTQKGES